MNFHTFTNFTWRSLNYAMKMIYYFMQRHSSTNLMILCNHNQFILIITPENTKTHWCWWRYQRWLLLFVTNLNLPSKNIINFNFIWHKTSYCFKSYTIHQYSIFRILCLLIWNAFFFVCKKCEKAATRKQYGVQSLYMCIIYP